MNCSICTKHRSLTFSNERGAVLLLAVYLTALTLLLFLSVSIQRNMINTRSAQIFRNKQQAFLLAAGALDYALRKIETESLPDADDYNAITSGNGTGTFELITLSTAVIDPETQMTTRTIIATGSVSESSAQVSATITEMNPLRGIWTEGPTWIWGSKFGPGTFNGDLRTSLGTVSAIKLTSNVQHIGQLQIAEPSATEQEYELTDSENTEWFEDISANWKDDPGVYLQTNMGASPTSRPNPDADPDKTKPRTAPMVPGAPVDAPYDEIECSGKIHLTKPGDSLEIADGDLMDLTPAGDGKIELCLQYIYASLGSNASEFTPKVIFRAPTTIYVTGKVPEGNNEFAVKASDLYAVEPGPPPETAPLILNGVKIIVTTAPEGERAGKVKLIQPERFSGSIYAPESIVYFLSKDPYTEYRIQNLIAREAELLTFGAPLLIGADAETSSSSSQTGTSSILSWTSE